MDLPKRLQLPCGNVAELLDKNKALYFCNYCRTIVGSNEEPEQCKRMREDAEPIKNDYWMDIENDEQNNQ